MMKQPVSYLTALGTALPGPPVSREQTVAFMGEALGLGQQERQRAQALYRATGIQTRHAATGSLDENGRFELFPDADSPFPSTGTRMRLYERFAAPLGAQAAHNCLPQNLDRAQITHLVTVSCTGMYAPGLDIDLLERLRLSPRTQRTCINFMGCYAAFNALRVADAFCKADPDAKVLLVSVELCSLHFKQSRSDDSMMAAALFADGAAAMLVEGRPPDHAPALKIAASHCDIHSAGSRDMAWNVRDDGFDMRLSAYVPDLLGGKARSIAQELLAKTGLDLTHIDKYAIHPGGRRILEELAQALQLDKSDLQASYDVLRECGNMSSATVIFVLEKLWPDMKPGQRTLSMAFGPGLTVESAVFEAV